MLVASIYVSMGGDIKDLPAGERDSSYHIPTSGADGKEHALSRLDVIRFLADKLVPFLTQNSASPTALTPLSHSRLHEVFSFAEVFHAGDWKEPGAQDKLRVIQIFLRFVRCLLHFTSGVTFTGLARRFRVPARPWIGPFE